MTAATASIRADPNATSAILTTVKAGTTLEVRGAEGEWYRIAMFVGPVRIQGYVSKRSVSGGDEPAPAGRATPAATPKSGASAPKPPATSAKPPAAAVKPAVAPAPVVKFGMSATVTVAAKPVSLTPVMARVRRIAERADSARAAAIAMPLGPGQPIPESAASTVTYLWLIDSVTGARAVPVPRPAFVVQYGDAPGISPDDFSPAIVRLIATPSGARVMSALRGRVDEATRAVADWDAGRELKQEIVKATVESTERGVAKVTPSVDLDPGEYAIVMRPTGNKKFAGTSVLSATADGRVFGIAWVFVVK